MLSRLRQFFPGAPPPGLPGDPGLFGPGSVAWRLGQERALVLGGPAALLLQVAHPLVAAGVAEHSDFTADPLRRLRGTLDATLTITFGDTAQAHAAARAVGRRHHGVRGALADSAGPHPAGTPYRATDPVLALWVWATLVWTAVRVTDGFVRPVGPAERDRYVVEMGAFAELFGVPPTLLPGTWRALDDDVAAQVGQVLTVGVTGRRLADQILRPDPPVVPWGLRRLPGVVAAGLLPEAVRGAYGLRWGRPQRLAFGAVRLAVRGALPLLPSRLRCWPHAAVARTRLR